MMSSLLSALAFLGIGRGQFASLGLARAKMSVSERSLIERFYSYLLSFGKGEK
jgi:hypothetical protein